MLLTRICTRSVVLPLVVVLTVSSLAIAQDQERRRGRGRFGGFGRGGFGPPTALELAQIDKVQSELKLTDEQKTRVNELAEMAREERGKLRESLRDLSREERRQRFVEKSEKLSKEMDEMLYEALDEGQSKRLKELVVQRQGVNALQNEEVAKKLALTDDQKSKVNSVFEQRRSKFRELFTPGQGFDRSKFEELNKETEQQAMAVLTPEQKEKFQQMQGAKFDFPERERRGRRGGRRDNDNDN